MSKICLITQLISFYLQNNFDFNYNIIINIIYIIKKLVLYLINKII